MLRWLSLVLLVLATSVAAFTDPSLESKDQCRARAWVRAPDLVPGAVIPGDVRIKLSGPCPDAESYALGLRYKERIFWKLRREDAPIPQMPTLKHIPMDRNSFRAPRPFQNTGNVDYNDKERIYNKPVHDQNIWSVHEDERMAFEIKIPLVGADSAEGAEPLPTSFTTRFGILVPNTNYPPGLDRRKGQRVVRSKGQNIIFSESAYEYFVEIKFSNGTTSEIPAGITNFTPVYHSTDNDAPRVSMSLEHMGPRTKSPQSSVDMLQSNYTIEIYFPDGAHVSQNSTVNITATVHRMGYTNRTDIPLELCVFLQGPNVIEWHPQELKNHTLAPSMEESMSMISARLDSNSIPCRDIDFAAAPTPLTHEGYISSTSSEPLSLSIHVASDVVPNFLGYYQKLGYRVNLSLQIKSDPSEPWENEFEKMRWERQIADVDELDETDFDWVPWMPPTQTRRRFLGGYTNISVIAMQKQGSVRSTPDHYLSDNARQPVFIDSSDIADLRLMLPEERDLIAPLAKPSIKVFAEGEELPHSRYYPATDMRRPIYVGDTWVKKVLQKGQRERDATDRLLVVQ
ncbi:hypothetical protein EDB19DRAFT_1904196 [Suillus lakei]|nr:hypothetical protein EDB19DRAFT_1904196 [Suillus lakei]